MKPTNQLINKKFQKVFLIILLSSLLITACNPQPVETGKIDQTTITFAVPGYMKDIYTPLAEAFEVENPGISVQIVTPSEFYELWNEGDLFNLASVADSSFHLSSQELLQNEVFFLDLMPLMENDPDFEKADFWQGSLSACIDETGKMVGLPLDLNMTGMMVDKTAFNQIGLTLPAPGWSWNEFMDVLQILSTKQDVVYLDSLTFFTSVLAPQIDSILSGKDELSKRLSDYEKAVQAGQIHAYDENQSIGERQTLLEENEPALWSASLYQAVEDMTGKDQAGHEQSFIPYPVEETSAHTTPIGVRCAMISQGSQHPREAWLWIKFLSEHWLVSADQGDRYQYIPARISVAESSSFWDGLPEMVEETVRFGLTHAWYGPEDAERLDWLQKAFDGVLAGETDLQTALSSEMSPISPSGSQTPVPQIVIATPEKSATKSNNQSIKFYSDTIDPVALQAILDTYLKTQPDVSIKLIMENNFMNIDLENYTRNYDCFSGLSMYVNNPYLFKEGELLPLNSFLELEPALSADFFPDQLDQYTREGTQLALPASQELPTLTYNVDLLNRLRIGLPTNDWSVTEFLNLINTVSAQSTGEPETFGYAMISDRLLLASKDISIEKSIPVFQFDGEKTISTVSWLKGLVDDNAVVRNLPDDPNRVAMLVAAGQVAIWDSAFNGWFFNGEEPDFLTEEVAIPFTSTPVSVNSGGQAYYISSRASDPKTCWGWISYLSSQPAAAMYWPVRQSVASSEEWQSLAGAEALDLFTAMQERAILSMTSSPQQQILQKIWAEAMKVIYAGSPVKTALTDAQRRADGYLKCMQMNVPEDAGNDLISKISEGCYNED